ncbi:MAG: hypothetical protein RL477_1523 [Pseudomonadota bacterium]|jgi:AmmeMemoRadiSam system protein B/AmmeMemoRadiSam system protein A
MNATAPTIVRKPFVAGTFYPAQADELRATVRQYMAGVARAQANEPPVPKAIIAPHAGYVYSGAIAATAYAQFLPIADRIRRVVLLGPSHRVGFRGLAVTTATVYETPLGSVPLDRAAAAALKALPAVVEHDAAHVPEHSLEVHVPFLQTILPSFTLLPIVVGDANPAQVAAVLDAVWGGPETVIVISSDLSHYEPYEVAQRIDGATANAIVQLDGNAIPDHGACGRRPVRGLLELARRRGLRCELLDLRNSGDTAGPKDRVVGYGSFALFEGAGAATDSLNGAQRGTLLRLARDVIHQGAHGTLKAEPTVNMNPLPAEFAAVRASFVTIEAAGCLRGCIGSLEAHRPLFQDVAANAWRSAFRDPRFTPVTPTELGGLSIKLSILSTPQEMRFDSEGHVLEQLRPGTDGLILSDAGRRGTFLPQVWEQLATPRDFLTRLKAKAGLALDHWSPTVRIWRYTTETFAEPLPPALD